MLSQTLSVVVWHGAAAAIGAPRNEVVISAAATPTTDDALRIVASEQK
jgi:hypothetical protein